MILIIDDERYVRISLKGLLTDEGYETRAVETAEKAEELLGTEDIDLILLDIQMPGKDGLSFLEDNRERLEGVPVIIISGRGDIPTAVAAIRLGAYDYMEKPLSPERVLLTIKRSLEYNRTQRDEKKLTEKILDQHQIIGSSEAVRKLRDRIIKAASADVPILISGENGTGKELVARQIHYRSARKAEPLVALNLPAIPETLFESELFGHVRGAFTGAAADRIGRFEQAAGGTIFLDEIGELPLVLQPKLLRILESGEFEKLGSDRSQTSQCRVLVATNRDLRSMIDRGEFREDLYYRLNVIDILVPPLRDRITDIPILLDYFLNELGATSEFRFSAEAAGLLATFEWPGNIRQLRNFVHQVVFNCDAGEIDAQKVGEIYRHEDPAVFDAGDSENRLTTAVRQFEIGFLSRLLQKHKGNISAMARELNMDRGNLSKKLKHLKIV